jgi:methyl-accepting chemotaxis protein
MINVRIRDERMIADWGKIIEVNAARTMGAVMATDPADQKTLEGLMAASSGSHQDTGRNRQEYR